MKRAIIIVQSAVFAPLLYLGGALAHDQPELCAQTIAPKQSKED